MTQEQILAQQSEALRKRLMQQGDMALTGASAMREEGTQAYRDFNPDQYLSSGALQALFDEAGAGFKNDLAGYQGTLARRGIAGPIAGKLEVDNVVSPFHRNLMATTAQFAGQRANLALGRAGGLAEQGRAETEYGFNTRGQGIGLLTSERELALAREQAKKQESADKKKGLGAGLGALAGGIIGSVIPGAGTMVGAGIGSALGGGIARLF